MIKIAHLFVSLLYLRVSIAMLKHNDEKQLVE